MSEKKPLPTNPSAPPNALLVAIKKVLRPFVRLLLSFHVTLPFLIELLKEIYVDVAERDFRLDSKKQTDTRISMLTGVHRKDTKRLRNRGHDQAQPNNQNPDQDQTKTPTAVSIGAQLVSKWVSDPEYLDARGKPRRLTLKADNDNPEAGFEHLVQSIYKQDMRARVILDEWLRLGIVSLVDEQWVELNTQGFIPTKGLEEKAYYLGMNIADHLNAAAQNLQAEKPPYLERCVYYDGLCEASIQELNQEAEKQGMALLQALNKKAITLKAHDKKHFDQLNQHDINQPDPPPVSDQPHRMNFGLYFYSQTEEQDHDVS